MPDRDEARILIIEDEKAMVAGLQFNLEARGYRVSAAYDGEQGCRKALELHPDLVILDLMLPTRDGYDVCRRLKKDAPDIPIIMLTARSQEADVVLGLELGADDYVTKPFSVLELMARIKTVLNRATPGNREDGMLQFGTVVVDVARHAASRSGAPLTLSPREYRHAPVLRQTPGRGRLARRTARRGVGIQQLVGQPHRGHPRGEAAAED